MMDDSTRLRQRVRHLESIGNSTMTALMCGFVIFLFYTAGKSNGRKIERKDLENRIEFLSACKETVGDDLYFCHHLLEGDRR